MSDVEKLGLLGDRLPISGKCFGLAEWDLARTGHLRPHLRYLAIIYIPGSSNKHHVLWLDTHNGIYCSTG